MMAKKKTAKKKVVLPKGARQGSKWTAEVVAKMKETILKLLSRGFTVVEACEAVSISVPVYNRWLKEDKKFLQSVKKIKYVQQEEEDSVRKQLVAYINKQVQKDIEKEDKVTALMKWWLNRADKIQKQRDDRAERKERAVVEDGFRERQLQIQELQNKVDEEREKRLLIEAEERKRWHESSSERRSELLWTIQRTIEEKVKIGVPPEEIAVAFSRKREQLNVVDREYRDHLAENKEGDFIFGKYGTTLNEVENRDVWQEMAEKIRKKPGEFIKA